MSHSSIWAKLISSLLCCAIQMSTGGAAGTCLACLMLLWAEKQKSEWIPRHKEAFQLVFIVLVWFGFWGAGWRCLSVSQILHITVVLHDGLVCLWIVMNESLDDRFWSLDRIHWSLSPWNSSSGTKCPLLALLRVHRLCRLSFPFFNSTF